MIPAPWLSPHCSPPVDQVWSPEGCVTSHSAVTISHLTSCNGCLSCQLSSQLSLPSSQPIPRLPATLSLAKASSTLSPLLKIHLWFPIALRIKYKKIKQKKVYRPWCSGYCRHPHPHLLALTPRCLRFSHFPQPFPCSKLCTSWSSF